MDSLVTVGTDVAGALAIARQERIVHGDVKPANVLISADGHAKLTDFGIARQESRTFVSGRAGGSFWSLTPEHLREEEITQQADLYALGVLLYRMLCSAHPFAVKGDLDTHRMLQGAVLPISDRIPPEMEVPHILSNLIDRLLDPDPRQRPNNTRGIRQVLRDVSRDIPMSVGSALLRESKPYFRAESPEDIPLQIPSELARSGRSRKKAPVGVFEQIGYWFTGLRTNVRWLILTLLATGVVVLAFYLVSLGPTVVHFSAPVTEVADGRNLPDEVSKDWLLDEVRAVVREELGNIDVTGAVGTLTPRVLYSRDAAPKSPVSFDEKIDISMRCGESVCIVSIVRSNDNKRSSERAVLLKGMPLSEWKDAVRHAARTAYR